MTAADRCQECGHKLMVWHKQAILSAILAWYGKHGEVPTTWQWRHGTPDHPDQGQVRAKFGSFTDAVAAAGLEPRATGCPETWTDAQILDAITDWHVGHGRPPACREWLSAGPGRPSAQTVKRRFGTWNAAMRAAGITAVRARGVRVSA